MPMIGMYGRVTCLIAAVIACQVAGPKADQRGLKFEWFQGENFDNKIGDRVELKIESYFGDGAPGPGCNVDHFSCKWTGFLAMPSSGEYQFCAKADDGFRFFLNDQLVLSGWDYNGAKPMLTQKSKFKKGDVVAVRFEYRDREFAAFARLAWCPPGSAGFVTVPAGAFFQTKEAALVASSGADAGVGLEMRVFEGINFKTQIQRTSDSNIDHIFWTDSPFQGVPPNRYSIRWHGFFVTPSEDLYQIIAYADDGVRIAIDGNVVVDDLKPLSTARREAAARLSLGVHEINVEYVQYDGDAFISLHWAVDGKLVEHVMPPLVFFRDTESATAYLKARSAGEKKDSK